jgi:hypothetical protein
VRDIGSLCVGNSPKNMSPKSTSNIFLLWLSNLGTTLVVAGVTVFRKYEEQSIVPCRVGLAEPCTARDSFSTFGCALKTARTPHHAD